MARATRSEDPALDRALEHIRRQFGPGAITRLGDGPALAPADIIPTWARAASPGAA